MLYRQKKRFLLAGRVIWLISNNTNLDFAQAELTKETKTQ